MVAADAMHREIRDDASPSHRRVSGEDRCVVVRPEMMKLSVVALGEIALHRRTHPFVGVGALDLGRLLQRLEPAETTHDPAALLEQERAIRRDRGAVERGHGHGALAQPPIPPVFAFLRPAEDPAEAPYDRAKDGERSVRRGSGDEQERPDLETPSAQQAGYLVCDDPAVTVAADEVRSLWERGLDHGGILEGHRFDRLAPGDPVGSVRRESAAAIRRASALGVGALNKLSRLTSSPQRVRMPAMRRAALSESPPQRKKSSSTRIPSRPSTSAKISTSCASRSVTAEPSARTSPGRSCVRSPCSL